MAAGRPTLYESKRIAAEITAYLKECKSQFYLPTVEGLAVHLCVARSTIYQWAKDHSEFSDILEQILALQASVLIQNGLKGEYNTSMAKMMLTEHGYKEESNITSGGQPINPLTDGDRKALSELRDLLKQRAA